VGTPVRVEGEAGSHCVRPCKGGGGSSVALRAPLLGWRGKQGRTVCAPVRVEG
jgi:hypothetical protein